MNKVKKWLGLPGLLMRLGKGKLSANELKKIIHNEEISAAGVSFDTYSPIAKKNGRIWIAVHGMTVNGKKDKRLIHFAQSLAGSGVTCIVPTLKSLAACKWETTDLTDLQDLIDLICRRYGQEVGLIGFSFGGSYCLLTACQPSMRDKIARVICFGALYNLQDFFADCKKSSLTEPLTDEDWDEWIYRFLVIVYGYGKTSLPPDLQLNLQKMLQNYCGERNIEVKKEFYVRYIRGLDLAGMINHAVNEADFESLSPTGRLGNLTCPVTLIHDRLDRVVPPMHAGQLFAELMQQSPAASNRHRLILTSLLSHVSLRSILNAGDFARLLNALGDML